MCISSSPSVSFSVEEAPIDAKNGCEIAKHILIATVAAVALAVFIAAVPLCATFAYFMFSIALVSNGLALVGAGVIAAIFAGIMGRCVYKHSVKADDLLNA